MGHSFPLLHTKLNAAALCRVRWNVLCVCIKVLVAVSFRYMSNVNCAGFLWIVICKSFVLFSFSFCDVNRVFLCRLLNSNNTLSLLGFVVHGRN